MIEDVFRTHLKESKIFSNRDALSPHFVPDTLPNRERQIEELSRTLAPILSGRKPENVFIYGKTGVGKTAVTRYVLRKLEDFAKEHEIPVKGIYINCRIHDSRHRVLMKVADALFPGENFLGLSTTHIYDRILSRVSEKGLRLIVVLDEIDKLKGISETVYALNRANDELERGSISIIGISNNLTFKESLDARTKSTLCQKEMIFPPYNAEELRRILEQRAQIAFKKGAVDPSAIALAAAYAAKQSGDARYALALLLRAGELAEEENAERVTEDHVRKAREKVEEDIVLDMIKTLPQQEQIVLLALARLISARKGIRKLGEGETVITSGELFEAYVKTAKELGVSPVSDRWFREYISELDTYGIIRATPAGKGFRGNTRVIRLNIPADKVLKVLEGMDLA